MTMPPADTPEEGPEGFPTEAEPDVIDLTTAPVGAAVPHQAGQQQRSDAPGPVFELPDLPALPARLTSNETEVLGLAEGLRFPLLPLTLASTVSGVEILGRGASGVVVRALATDVPVAAKLYYPASGERLAPREFRYAKRNYGRHVARAFGLLSVRPVNGELPVLVLVEQLVDGPSLQKLMDDGVVPRPVDLERYLGGMLRGLSHTAADDVAMRDMKPANVVLDSLDLAVAEAVIVDQGGARRLGNASADPAIGTIVFAAPEAVMHGQANAGPPADVWSAGITILASALGTMWVFDTDETDISRDAMAAAMRATLRGLPRLADAPVSPRLRAVLAGALVKDPARRPSAELLLDVLEGRKEPLASWDPNAPARRVPASAQVRARNAEPSRRPPLPAESALNPDLVESQEDLSVLPDVAMMEDPPKPDGSPSRLLRMVGISSEFVTSAWERTVLKAAAVGLMGYAVYALAGSMAFANVVGVRDWWLGLPAGAVIVAANLAVDISLLNFVAVDLTSLHDTSKDFRQPLQRNSASLAVRMLVRILTAVVFALGVGEPVNLFLLRGDVKQQLLQTAPTRAKPEIQQINALYDDQLYGSGGTEAHPTADSLTGQDEKDRATIKAAKAAPKNFSTQAGQLDAGAYGTGVGCGPTSHCQELLGDAKTANADNQNPKGVLQTTQRNLDARQKHESDLAAKDAEDVKAAVNHAATKAGFLDQETALLQVISHSNIALFRYLIIVVLLFLVEMAAVLTKLFTHGGPYEQAQARWTRRHTRRETLRARLDEVRAEDQFTKATQIVVRRNEVVARRDGSAADAEEGKTMLRAARAAEHRANELQRIALAGQRTRARENARHVETLRKEGIRDADDPVSAL